MNEFIYLVDESFEADEIGNDTAILTERGVWADVDSVTQSEYNMAAQNGLKPEYRFRVWANEYRGAQKVKYGGKQYRIYRTYKNLDLMELYVEEDV